MQRYRTINGAWKEIHEMDKHSEISLNLIRSLVDEGVCPSIKSGNRRLINLDVLLDILSGKTSI